MVAVARAEPMVAEEASPGTQQARRVEAAAVAVMAEGEEMALVEAAMGTAVMVVAPKAVTVVARLTTRASRMMQRPPWSISRV